MSTLLTRMTPSILFLLIIGVSLYLLSYVKENTIQGANLKEGFAMPTRASDCRCLPGYIPSNTIHSLHGGEFQNFKGTIAFVPARSNQKHWVRQCVMCGINVCDSKEHKKVDQKEWEKTRFGSVFNCNILKKAKEDSKLEGTFFCQNLTDPNKRLSCY